MTDPWQDQPPSFEKQQPQAPGRQQPAPYGNQPYGTQPFGAQPYPPGYGQQPYPPGYGQPGWGPPLYGYPAGAVQKPTGWFVVNWIFLWPLAIYSLVSAWQNIDPAQFRGDVVTAQYHADRVRKFGIIALCVSLGLNALWIIAVIAIVASAPDCYGSYCS